MTITSEPKRIAGSVSSQNPTTLGGMKRRAAALKKVSHVKHAEALKQAAQQAGYANYPHAQSSLKHNTPALGQVNKVFITCYWVSIKLGTSGRETLRIQLQREPSAMLSLVQLSRLRNQPKLVAADHVVLRDIFTSSDSAKSRVCQTARELMFADATLLKPLRNSRLLQRYKTVFRFPKMDHTSLWGTGDRLSFVLVDEPYPSHGADLSEFTTRRTNWANENNLAYAQPNWRGMYAPEMQSQAFFITPKDQMGINIEGLCQKVDRLSSQPVSTSWSGESHPFNPIFRSPAEETADRPGFRTSIGSPRNSNKTAPSGTMFGHHARRPLGKMSLPLHSSVGEAISSALEVCDFRWQRIERHLNSARSNLDDWLQREYSASDVPGSDLNDYYYRASRSDQVENIPMAEAFRELNHALTAVRASYPECQPRAAVEKHLCQALLLAERKFQSG